MAYNARERVKQLRARRKLEGLRRVEYWLNPKEKYYMDEYYEVLSKARSNRPDSNNDTSNSTE